NGLLAGLFLLDVARMDAVDAAILVRQVERAIDLFADIQAGEGLAILSEHDPRRELRSHLAAGLDKRLDEPLASHRFADARQVRPDGVAAPFVLVAAEATADATVKEDSFPGCRISVAAGESKPGGQILGLGEVFRRIAIQGPLSQVLMRTGKLLGERGKLFFFLEGQIKAS